ncbi:MAG: DNA recombination protein RmuC [Stappiaceae bacterium]
MDQVLFQIGNRQITLAEFLIYAACTALFLLLVLWIQAMRQSRRRGDAEAAAQAQTREMELRLGELMKTQSEMTGRMQTMAEVFGTRQADLSRGLNERMDGLGQKIGQSMVQTTKSTQEGLTAVHERLAVIDRAQKTISDLSGQVTELQNILSNKQSRGAFGQGRMEAIIQDALPASAYVFQGMLSNDTRPDCLILMPNDAPPLVIDAKFPLEAFNMIRDAALSEELKAAHAQFRRDMAKHIGDISDRYLLPGETQDTAFMFVPSESVFAELHENFEDVIQKAHRARVILVSPSLLNLSIQVIQSVLKDAKMREQAHLIQAEVGRLMQDIGRLDDRVRKLQSHFSQSQKDIDQILISTDKVTKRSRNIEDLELGELTNDEQPVQLTGGSAAG